jgi:dTDP-glucose 4,6-dehydratase
MSFHCAFNTPVATIRPFNTYGPRQSARAVIPTVVTQIMAGNRKLKLGALHPTRDFSYVLDTAKGFIAVAESEDTVGEVINCGSNYEISIGDIVKLIAEIMGADIEIETDAIRFRPEKSEVERLWCDNAKIERITGFKPQTTLREGLEKTIEWFADPANLQRYKTEIYNV